MVKVLVSDKLSSEGVKILQDAGFEVDCKYKLSPQELKESIAEYQGIIIRSDTKLTKDVIEAASNLKVIARAGVGVDNVDIEAATKKGIIVMNAPGGNTISTCEQSFALMLSVARNIPFAHASLKSKQWERSKFKGAELYSKVLGIVGLGRIGKEVAKRALAFGMDVLVYDPFVSQDLAERIGVKLSDLENLLKTADFITVHTPLTPETKGLISDEEFSLMKPAVFVINCARGGIIDETALAKALKEKRIAGAALDVFSKEPPFDLDIMDLDSIVLTPHLGASTQEAQVNVAIEAAHCLKDALLGKAIRNAINYIQLDPETYKIVGPYFNLAEKMGLFMSQIIEGGIKELQISYLGEISSYKVDVLGAAFVKGILLNQLEKGINYINALEIAKARGIKIEQVKVQEEEEYVNSIRVKVITDKEQRLIEGTLFANKEARFVKIDNVYTEIEPSEYMLVIRNQDKPGVIGFLGTTLGKCSINIAGMSLGREASGDIALTIINLDSALSPEIIAQIKSNPNILSLQLVKL
ncbi:MAG: phosphoglycerate dehydrogenase [Candidatus Omnitrophica bacterium]|nr:phosphoglycerate dehydrogenase [Candidatus Omnitrophota bacterium]MDD5430008.1 phosphoglycerate dehydrogenase [Candidatus Omnitrophota bacterium]